MPEQGTLELVGAGEFLEIMRDVNAGLLERAGGRRVAILPTASAPDGPGVPERWAAMGLAHFTALGAQPEAVMALDWEACHVLEHVEAVRRADLVYFSGGKPDYLLRTLQGTPLWEAILLVLGRGGVVAGCSAGAMVLGGWLPGSPTLQRLSLWQTAFGLVPGALVLPHFNEFPAWLTNPLYALRRRGAFLLGIEGDTALIGRGEAWVVRGQGRVEVRWEGAVSRFTEGQAVPL